jgi:hypothetical protein
LRLGNVLIGENGIGHEKSYCLVGLNLN